MSKKPTVLMILDGFGLNDKKDANAVYEAKTPVIDNLMATIHLSKAMPAGCPLVFRKVRWATLRSDI